MPRCASQIRMSPARYEHVWGGHSCPQLLTLIFLCTHSEGFKFKNKFKGGGQECPPHTCKINFYGGVGLVMAPCDAEVTSAAYLANTPVL